MPEITFTQFCQDKIRDIDIEKLASENNVVGVGQKISELAQLMSRINTELSSRQWAYNLKVKFCYEGLEKKSVALAKMEAESSTEWKDLRDCVALKESILEMLKSLKYLARSLQEEYKHTV